MPSEPGNNIDKVSASQADGSALPVRATETPDRLAPRKPQLSDLRSMRAEIEHQVRDKPGLAVLIALGVGYVIGRLLRDKRGT